MDDQGSNAKKPEGFINRFITCVANIILFIYYLVYFMFKGRDSSYNNDPSICAVHKCPLQSVTKGTNVCCVYGIQTKGASTEDGSNVKAPEQRTKTDEKAQEEPTVKPIEEATQENVVKSHTQLIKNRFEKLAEKANGINDRLEEKEKDQPSTWLQKACSYFGFKFSKPGSKSDNDNIEKKGNNLECGEDQRPKENDTKFSNGTAVGPPKAPPPPPTAFHSHQQQQPFTRRASDSASTSRSEIEPHYPLSLFADRTHMNELKERINSRAAELDQHQKLQGNVIISVKPSMARQDEQLSTRSKIERQKIHSSKAEEEEEEEEEENDELEKRRLRYPKPQTYYQVPQKAHLIIKTTYEDDHAKNIQIIKKDWSSEVNGTARKVSKAETPFYGAQTSTGTSADRIGNFSNPAANGLSSAVNYAASKKNIYNSQVLEQVRRCKNISKELKSGSKQSTSGTVSQPLQFSPISKAQNMFLTRKNRMQKWVVSSANRRSSESESGLKTINVDETSSSTSEVKI